jgi:Flp pilus assembly protein CpaB
MLQLKIGIVLALIAIPPMAGFCPLNRMDYPSEADKRGHVVVLVAKKNLALGTVIKDPAKYFIEEKLPSAQAPEGYFGQIEQLKNQKLKKPLSEGACITKDYILTDADLEEVLKALIPEGHVAFTVSAKMEGLGGWIQPMDLVDVVVVSPQDDGKVHARTLLKRVRVLSSDTDESVIGRAKWMALIKMDVTPEQSEQLKNAMRDGELRVFLSVWAERNSAESSAPGAEDLPKGK